MEEITETIHDAKANAVDLAKSCNINLDSFDDKELLISVQEAVDHAVANDGESDENVPEDTVTAEGTISSSSSSENSENGYMTFQEIITIREDLSQLRLRKTSDEGTFSLLMESLTVEDRVRVNLTEFPSRWVTVKRSHRLYFTMVYTFGRQPRFIFFKNIPSCHVIVFFELELFSPIMCLSEVNKMCPLAEELLHRVICVFLNE